MPNLATDKNRWIALIVLALGLAIVIIDNTVLNVAIPYILRDLKTTLDALQWVISGYALIIATLLVTVGRLGDLFGRRRIFSLGLVLFAIGSFIASISNSATTLFVGEALIEAIGAAMMLTSSLSLLVTEFQARERAIAFGVWGSVAGASAAFGPLLGGYLTAYHSWRWSLRINVVVALIALIGTIFVKEAKGDTKGFDWLGTIFSGLGLFLLVFGFIEGQKYGWWTPATSFSLGSWTWPLSQISVIPFTFLGAAFFLDLFALTEYYIEQRGGSPLLRLSLFQNKGFSFGLITLGIVSLGQFGIFFILPIYLQNVLGIDAFHTGIVFLAASISIFIFGPLSGFVAAKTGPKIVINLGMFIAALGIFILSRTLSLSATGWTLVPGLIVFGIGAGMTSSQLTNIVLSAVPVTAAGEASAVSSTMRQVGTSVGIAVIGAVLATTLSSRIMKNIKTDDTVPSPARSGIIDQLSNISIESGQPPTKTGTPATVVKSVKTDVQQAIVTASQKASMVAFWFVLAGAIFALLLPNTKPIEWPKED